MSTHDHLLALYLIGGLWTGVMLLFGFMIGRRTAPGDDSREEEQTGAVYGMRPDDTPEGDDLGMPWLAEQVERADVGTVPPILPDTAEWEPARTDQLAIWSGQPKELTWYEREMMGLVTWRTDMDAEADAFIRGEIDLPLTAGQELEAVSEFIIHWRAPDGKAPCDPDYDGPLHPQRKYVTCPACKAAAYLEAAQC